MGLYGQMRKIGGYIVKINIKYLIAFLLILLVEVIIALFVKDTIIRPYGGDLLVIILIYTLVRGITPKAIKLLPIYIFLFAVLVELAQYYRVMYMLNLHENKVLSTIIGTSFDIKDIFAYLIATVALIIWECVNKNR